MKSKAKEMNEMTVGQATFELEQELVEELAHSKLSWHTFWQGIKLFAITRG